MINEYYQLFLLKQQKSFLMCEVGGMKPPKWEEFIVTSTVCYIK